MAARHSQRYAVSMNWRVPLGTVAFGLASVVNPAFVTGCARLGLTYDFGEPEVVALVDAASHGGPYRFKSDAREVEVSVALSQARGEDTSLAEPLLVRSALACGHRTFLRSASACLDTTSVPVEGTLTVKAVAGSIVLDRLPVTGALRVVGTHIRSAELSLTGGPNLVEMRSDDGKTFAVRGMQLGG
jgi:hypothetical protein